MQETYSLNWIGIGAKRFKYTSTPPTNPHFELEWEQTPPYTIIPNFEKEELSNREGQKLVDSLLLEQRLFSKVLKNQQKRMAENGVLFV